MNPEKFQSYTQKIIDNCGKIIVGKDEVIRQVVVTFLCGGHVLLEDKWASYALRSLEIHSECDHALIEPGKTVVRSATVDNYSRLPIPFVRLLQDFPNEAKSEESESWWHAFCRKNLFSWCCEYRMTLRGTRKTS